MSWVVFAGLVALTLVVLYLPGTVVALAGRLPLTASLAAAPAISVAVVSLVAIVADAVSLPLGPLPVVGGTLLVAGGMLAICSASRRLSLPRVASRGESGASAVRPPVARIWWLLTALGASALMGRRIVSVLRSPESFTQTLDGIYHLNAVRWIIDHTNGSALTMAMTAGDRPPSFYPLGWHDMISVTLLSAGSRDVIAGTNAMIMAVAAVVWTGGCLYLVSTIVDCSVPGIVATGILTCSFASFPLLAISFGVIYPNFLGVSLLPGTIAITLHFFGLAARPIPTPVVPLAAVLMLAVGTALAHPNTMLTYIVMLLPILITWCVVSVRRAIMGHQPRLAALVGVLTLLGLGVIAVIWTYLRPPLNQALWAPIFTTGESIVAGITFAMGSDDHESWLLCGLLIVGTVVALAAKRFWLVAAALIMGFLWVAVASWPWADDRSLLVGGWYNDPVRVSTFLPLFGLPLMAVGVQSVGAAIVRQVHRRWPRLRHPQVWVAALSIVVLLIFTQFAPYLTSATYQASRTYELRPRANLVDINEMTLLRELPGLVPPGTVLATVPFNGSSMAYALVGVPTTTTHLPYETTPDLTAINEGLRDAASRPDVCAALDRMHVGYALDFGPEQVNGGVWDRPYPGFKNLGSAPGFVPVARVGSNVLYRIDAC